MTLQESLTRGTTSKSLVGIKAPYFDGTQPCAETDPEIFFPENAQESREVRRVVEAMCNSCHFQKPCLEYALNHVLYGTWGGYTEAQRNKLGGKKRYYAKQKSPS